MHGDPSTGRIVAAHLQVLLHGRECLSGAEVNTTIMGTAVGWGV